MKTYLRSAAFAIGLLSWQASALAASPSDVQQLIAKDLIGVPGKEVLMLTVEYLPGGASLPHRH